MHLFLSAAHKSSGKTTITLGLIELLRREGLRVAPCKKGPDFIDPIWLSIAADIACKNLDTFVSTEDEVISDFISATEQADITLVEGNKGLYDGVALDGSNSNAAVAKLLKTPVILIIDCHGITRGIAPLLLGYQAFDTDIQIGGVILNRIGGKRHESKLRAAVEYYTDIPVLGAVANNDSINIDEQHLGLIPGNELSMSKDKIKLIADHMQHAIDIKKIINIAHQAKLPALSTTPSPTAAQNSNTQGLRVGVIMDRAFGFYYPGDIQAFKDLGASIIKINALEDQHLPKTLDALFIGGGFPERHAEKLSKNTTLRQEIYDQIQSGLPCYAECGGLMYLSKGIQWHEKTYDMVGIIDAYTKMYPKPQGRGYVKLQKTNQHLWHQNEEPIQDEKPLIHAHEFHYSKLEDLSDDQCFSYQIKRGIGIDNLHDGLIINNLVASYTHMRNTQNNPWVKDFLNFVAKYRDAHENTD